MEERVEVKQTTIKRINGYLHRIIPIADTSGKIINYAIKPLMVEFKPRDIIQVVIGSSLLAIPVSLTEEAWNLGTTLPNVNIILIALLSMLLISIFVFFNFYRNNFKGFKFSFLKRTIGTYLISLIVVSVILTIIEKCPWSTDHILAIKRIIIVAFPASLSGTLSDMIK
ncbi:DUF2391 family protein [Saccharicrinis aurantiacus]|uniref:DUF2391 family protein n=1 Tax=Saccharicrinis aurantiacus TaxID=1849719 RepID=UPI00248FA3C6|nr:DUF2391 family protein [Saccharicrinis aurantiacus]